MIRVGRGEKKKGRTMSKMAFPAGPRKASSHVFFVRRFVATETNLCLECQCMGNIEGRLSDITVDAMNNVFARQRGDLGIDFNEEIGKLCNKIFPFLLC
jgi:hypothetical protein